MKIRCDVCDQAEASVFCYADEAALCHGCDLHVHRANKLAGKHSRFSLIQPMKKDSPRCDICQVILILENVYVLSFEVFVKSNRC